MSIWDQYPHYKPTELRELVQVTTEVLLDGGESDQSIPEDLLLFSPRSVATELEEEFNALDSNHMLSIFENEELEKQVIYKILDEVRKYPDLADEIDHRYSLRQQKMASPELILLSGALLILAIRVKEIKLTKKSKRIIFYPSRDAVKAFVSGLVNKLPGT